MNPINSVLQQPRPSIDPSYLSKRQRIMMWFEDSFNAVRANVTGFQNTFTAVARRALTKQEQQSGCAIALYDLTETKTPQMQFQFCELTVFAEFYRTVAIGENPADALNMLLTDVQRVFRSDVTCGGLTINISEKRNQIDTDGPLEKTVTGVVEFVVQYRHAADDPRR